MSIANIAALEARLREAEVASSSTHIVARQLGVTLTAVMGPGRDVSKVRSEVTSADSIQDRLMTSSGLSRTMGTMEEQAKLTWARQISMHHKPHQCLNVCLNRGRMNARLNVGLNLATLNIGLNIPGLRSN